MNTELKISQITFDWLEENNYPSVTDYCRFLIKQGNPLPDQIQVWRKGMLCLTVTDVVEAAGIMPTGTGFTKYDKTKRKASLQARTCV